MHKGYLFFFSSRRRHTRSKRDWSSDVCSSDLAGEHHARDREPPLADLAVVSHEELAQLRLRDVNAGQGENTAQLGADLSRQPVEDAARIAVGGSLEHEVRRSAG